MFITEYYRSTQEAVSVQQSNIGIHGGSVGTAEYYRSTLKALCLQQSTIGAHRLCWYRRVLQ